MCIRDRWLDGAYWRTETCTTDGEGQCSLTTPKIHHRKTSATATVDDVTHVTFTYQPTDNYDPDCDSDGTTGTVSRPW